MRQTVARHKILGLVCTFVYYQHGAGGVQPVRESTEVGAQQPVGVTQVPSGFKSVVVVIVPVSDLN